MHWPELFTSGASLFIVATATTKTMVPLRALTIAANVFFALVFADLHLWLPMALQAPCAATQQLSAVSNAGSD